MKKTYSLLPLLLLLFSSYFNLNYANKNYFIISAKSDVIGKIFKIKTGRYSNLSDIAFRYRIAYDKLIAANPNITEEFTYHDSIQIPAQYILPQIRSGIVINLAQLRLFYFPPQNTSIVYSYPIAVGSREHPTPQLSTYIYEKIKNPTWTVPKSIINELDNEGIPVPKTTRIPPGKYNPLGKYAMRLGESSYLIHGTNAQNSIGQYITHGCIRMYNQDIKELFSLVADKTSVHIINQTIQVGQKGDNIVLSINYNPYTEIHYSDLDTIEYEIKKILNQFPIFKKNINWLTIEEMIENSNSLPQKINLHSTAN